MILFTLTITLLTITGITHTIHATRRQRDQQQRLIQHLRKEYPQ